MVGIIKFMGHLGTLGRFFFVVIRWVNREILSCGFEFVFVIWLFTEYQILRTD